MSAANYIKKKKNDDIEEEEEIQEIVPKKEVKKDTEDSDDFDINPMRKKCSFCNTVVVTYVEHEGHPLFVIFAFISLFIIGLLSFILLPIAYLLTKNAVHRCSRCLQKLGEKQCFGLPQNIAEQIWTFRLGKCTIVLSRIYAVLILLLTIALCGYYIYYRPSFFQSLSPYEAPKESVYITTSWQEFLKDCGGEVIVENYVHARNVFNQKYEQNIVQWTGYFADQKRSNSLSWFQSDHALNVLIKMSPTESTLYPDLVLSIPTSLLNTNKDLFKDIKKGDQVKFEAKMVSLGNEFKMHHLHAHQIETTGQFKELNEILVKESALP